MKIFNRRNFVKSGISLAATAFYPFEAFHAPSREYKQVENVTPLIPDRLKPGDLVAIMGIAGALRDEKVLVEFKVFLERIGFRVLVGETASKFFGYLSGTDEERVEEFNQLVANPEVKAIFFTKGGWGSARILDKINFDVIRNNPKVLVGFSDLTSLLTAVNSMTGLITFHGPLGNSSWQGTSLSSLLGLVCQARCDLDFHAAPQIQGLKTLRSGSCEGPFIGGNLSVFCSLLGTPYFPNCKDKILFLEEVHEEPYSIDRMLNSLRLAGVFSELAGVVFGQFKDCNAENPSISFSLEEVVEQLMNHLSIPVLWGASFGHVKYNSTIPVGAVARLDADQQTLFLLQPSVR